MAIPTLATPSFISGPLDELKAIDPYEVVKNLPESEITSVLDRLDATLLDKIKPQLNNKNVNQALRLATQLSNGKKLTLTTNQLLSNARKLSPTLTGILDSVQSDTKNTILNTIKQFEISPTITKSLSQLVNSTSVDRLLAQNGVQNFVKNLTNMVTGGRAIDLSNPKFVSLMLGGVIHQGNKLGMEGVLGDLFDALDDRQTINLITGLVVKSVARNGSLTDFYQLANRSSRGYVKSTYPKSIETFVRSYKVRSNRVQRNLSNELDMILETFDIIDPNWYVEYSSSTTYIKLTHVLNGSKDFNDVADYASVYRPTDVRCRYLAYAKHFKSTTVPQSLKRERPYLVLR